MLIRELAQQTGVPTKTIRYYESIGLLPRPRRAANNYRQYTSADEERLRIIAGGRSLGLALSDIAEILATREAGIAPCERVLHLIEQRLVEIDRGLADLLRVRDVLTQLHTAGALLPLDDMRGEHCVCHLLKARRDARQVTHQKRGFYED